MPGIPRTLPEVIRKAVSGSLQDVHVALPCQVQRYDATSNLADVQVGVMHPVYDDDNRRTYEDMGVLVGVPVMFPRAGGFVITLPLAAGDTGLLVFNSTGIGEWRASGQTSQPADASRHSIGWPVFLPGLFPDASPMAAGDVTARSAGIVIGKDGASQQIRIGASTVDVGAGATDFIALASLVLARLTSIQSAFDAHTHSYLPGPGAATPTAVPTTPIGSLASVAATIARAK